MTDFMPSSLSRRNFLRTATAAVSATVSAQVLPGLAAETPVSKNRYKIGVCDWMILKRQKLGAFKWTKDIGADGVEVDMGSLGQRDTFDSQLADPAVRNQFLNAARDSGLEICSLAMSGF